MDGTAIISRADLREFRIPGHRIPGSADPGRAARQSAFLSAFRGGFAATFSLDRARAVSKLSFGLGAHAALASVGIRGGLRSRPAGIATSMAALLGIAFVTWVRRGFA